jgi:dienelactone hydrolase
VRARRAALCTLVLLAAGVLAGCAAHQRTPLAPGDLPPLLPVAAGAYDYVAGPPAVAVVPAGEEQGHWVHALAMPSVGENGQPGDLVTARYYQGKQALGAPLVIVLPIWGVHAYPSETIASNLREHGGAAVNVLEVLGDRRLFDWEAMGSVDSEPAFYRRLDRMVVRFIDAVTDVRRLVDWAQTRPEVGPRRIALIGFSMGAVVASVAVAHEPRLAAGVLVMGGADPHEVLAACNREIEAFRERVLARLGWSLDHFRSELERELAPINPARFAGMADPRRVLIIEAGDDTCVPQAARDRLWQAFGRPERIVYDYDHRMAFLAMTFLGGHHLQRQVYRFLDRVLAAPSNQQLTQDAAARAGLADPG